MKERKQFKTRCPECEKEIIGFSEDHARINLYIHRQTSKRHDDIVRLLKKRSLS